MDGGPTSFKGAALPQLCAHVLHPGEQQQTLCLWSLEDGEGTLFPQEVRGPQGTGQQLFVMGNMAICDASAGAADRGPKVMESAGRWGALQPVRLGHKHQAHK